MFIQNFKNMIISELKYVLSEMPEEERTIENFIEKFSAHIGGSAAEIKKKKTPVKKDFLDENVRCCALKKDGDQCNGKRLTRENVLTDLCSLHTRNGVKFGYYSSSTASSDEEAPVVVEEAPVVVEEAPVVVEEAPVVVEETAEETPEVPMVVVEEKKPLKKRGPTKLSKIKESLKKESAKGPEVIYDYRDEPDYVEDEEKIDCDSDFE